MLNDDNYSQIKLYKNDTCQSKYDILIIDLTSNCSQDQVRAILLIIYNYNEKIYNFLQILVIVCDNSIWEVFFIRYNIYFILYIEINSIKYYLER